MRRVLPFALLALVAACSSPQSLPLDLGSGVARDLAANGSPDLEVVFTDAGVDGGAGNGCAVSGAPGQCITTTECAALGDHTAYPGHCPGAADIQCCIQTPSTTSNPPIPAGYKLMAQVDVTPAMTSWAVTILNDPTTYPMFSTAMMTFPTLMVLARVEWHAPDFQNGVVHRGVTLYQPI